MATERDIRVRLSLIADGYNQGIRQADEATARLEGSLRRLQQTSSGTSGATERLTATANRVKFGMDTAGKAAARAADDIRKTGKAADDASDRFERFERAFSRLKGGIAGLGLGMVAAQIARFGAMAVQSASHMQGLEIQIAAVVAANGKIADSNGRVLSGIEKINAARQISADVFAKLQADAMNTTATTEELIELYATALPSALGAGLDLDAIRKVVVSMSNAMKVLRIDSQQAKSEMRALFSGEINQDSDLAKQLGIRKEDIALAKQKGQLEQFLLDKMKEYNAAAAIQAGTLEGLSSSIQDMGQKWMRIVGQRPMEILTEGARFLLREIMGTEGATTSLHRVMAVWAADTSQGLSQLVSGVAWLGKQIIWVLGLINRADYHLQSWAVNVREKVVGSFMRVAEQSAKLGGILPWNRQASQDVVQQLQKDQVAFAKGIAAARKALNEREFGDPKALMQRVGAPSRPMAGPGASGFRFTPNPARPDPKEAQKRQKDAERAARKAEQEAEKRQRELDRQQDERVRATQDQMQHRLRLNDAYEGGLSGRIRIMEQYLAVLKKLPRAEEEALDLSRDLELARIEQKVANLKREREEREKAAEAQKAAEQEQREYVIAIAESERDAKLKLIDQELEDTTHANDRKREALKRLYEDQKLGAADYYQQTARLRNEDLAAEANASLRRIAEERKVLMARREQLTNPLEGHIDWADVAKVDADLGSLDAEQSRVVERYRRGIQEANEDNAREFAQDLREQTRDGLEGALDAIFSGNPLEAIASTFLNSAKKGLIEALSDTEVGQGLASLLSGKAFGGGMVGGLAGLLVGGFASLVGSSFSDLRRIGEENKRIAADMAQTRAELSEDPLDDIRLKYQRQRDEIAERRSGGLKLFGMMVPGTWRKGSLSVDEEATLAAAEAKEVAEAQERSAKEAQAKVREEVDKTLSTYEKLRALGRMTLDEQIEGLRQVLAQATLSYEDRLELEVRLANLVKEKHDEIVEEFQQTIEDAIEFEGMGLADALERVTNKLAELRQQGVPESDEAYERLYRYRRQLEKDLASEQQETQRENIEKIKAWWQQAAEAASKAFEQLANAGNHIVTSLRNQFDDWLAREKDNINNLAINNPTWASRGEMEFELFAKQREELNRLINQLVSYAGDDDRRRSAIWNRIGGEASLNGQVLGAVTQADPVEAARMVAEAAAERGSSYIRTGTGHILSLAELQQYAAEWAALTQKYNAEQAEIVNLRNQMRDLNYEANERYWTGRSEVKDLLEDLEVERLKLRAQGDPAREREAREAEIDLQIRRRREQYVQAGYLSDEFATPEQRARIEAYLDSIEAYMKQQLDEQTNNRPTEANPLPVRVVELPPAFPLPASYYFRQAAQPVLRLEAGAIQINGSGLTDRQLTAAVEQAIVNAGTTLTRTVNRENLIGNAVVRVN